MISCWVRTRWFWICLRAFLDSDLPLSSQPSFRPDWTWMRSSMIPHSALSTKRTRRRRPNTSRRLIHPYRTRCSYVPLPSSSLPPSTLLSPSFFAPHPDGLPILLRSLSRNSSQEARTNTHPHPTGMPTSRHPNHPQGSTNVSSKLSGSSATGGTPPAAGCQKRDHE